MGIVKPRKIWYYISELAHICKKCHVFLRRLYVRDIYYLDQEGKRHERVDTYNLTKKRAFVPVAWWCPSCNRVTFDGQASNENTGNSQELGKIKCRDCGSTAVIKQKERGGSTQYRCSDCKAYFSVKANQTQKVNPDAGVTGEETCPECGAKVPNPDGLSELTCPACSEGFAC